MEELQRVAVIGLGLLGGSVILALRRRLPSVHITGYSHRASTRRKAAAALPWAEIVSDPAAGVSEANMVILASPVCTFERIFEVISPALRDGCLVTDVGSTKLEAARWAARHLPQSTHYIGSHPIAGSEQRGVEFARDDLFDGTVCILTPDHPASRQTRALKRFWTRLGCCNVTYMTAEEHDRVFAAVSHLPHILAASLVNAISPNDLRSSGKGMLDTTRIASGPAEVWTDILATNAQNCIDSIDAFSGQLMKFRNAVKSRDFATISQLLGSARRTRDRLVRYKIRRKELAP